jgi:hypothetical protein
MYRSAADTADPLFVFGPRLNSKNIDKKRNGQRVHVHKTWKKYARVFAYVLTLFNARCFCPVHVAADVTCVLCVCRWTSAQDGALARQLHALPDVSDPLSRAEVHRRQELLRVAVSPLRSWISVYLKICREAPYGLDLGHVLKTKLGKSCRQHMTPLRENAAGKPGTRRSRSRLRWRPGAGVGAGAVVLQVQAAEGCASPLILEMSEDDALESPNVLRMSDSPDLCASDHECALDTAEMCLWH